MLRIFPMKLHIVYILIRRGCIGMYLYFTSEFSSDRYGRFGFLPHNLEGSGKKVVMFISRVLFIKKNAHVFAALAFFKLSTLVYKCVSGVKSGTGKMTEVEQSSSVAPFCRSLTAYISTPVFS